jgi:hypothetical protein
MSDQADDAVASDVKRGRGRTPYRMSEEHRNKIRNSNILNHLIEHVSGTREMSSTQVTAGLGLLKKALPDLQSVSVQGEEDGEPINIIQRIERVLVNK